MAWPQLMLSRFHHTQCFEIMFIPVPPIEGRLIDIATGASVFPLMFTSRTVGEITATGYLESERQELQKWLRGDGDVVNFTPCLAYAAKLEGNGYVMYASIVSQ